MAVRYFYKTIFVDLSLLCIALPPHTAADAAEISLVWVKIPHFNREQVKEKTHLFREGEMWRQFCVYLKAQIKEEV